MQSNKQAGTIPNKTKGSKLLTDEELMERANDPEFPNKYRMKKIMYPLVEFFDSYSSYHAVKALNALARAYYCSDAPTQTQKEEMDFFIVELTQLIVGSNENHSKYKEEFPEIWSEIFYEK